MYAMATGRINFESDQFGVVLLTSEYQPDKRAHTTRADVEAFEVVGQGYRAGGQITDISVGLDDQDGLVITLGANRWLKASIRAGYAAYYRRGGGDAGEDELIAVIDFGEDVASTNATFSTSESVLRLQN
jgi:hypothetical protein